jgi:hypothetical protein
LNFVFYVFAWGVHRAGGYESEVAGTAFALLLLSAYGWAGRNNTKNLQLTEDALQFPAHLINKATHRKQSGGESERQTRGTKKNGRRRQEEKMQKKISKSR